MSLHKLLILLIKGYRFAVSPLFGINCRFYPTCSVYAVEAVERYGSWKGLLLTIKRIGRCHPYSQGGYDPVP